MDSLFQIPAECKGRITELKEGRGYELKKPIPIFIIKNRKRVEAWAIDERNMPLLIIPNQPMGVGNTREEASQDIADQLIDVFEDLIEIRRENKGRFNYSFQAHSYNRLEKYLTPLNSEGWK